MSRKICISSILIFILCLAIFVLYKAYSFSYMMRSLKNELKVVLFADELVRKTTKIKGTYDYIPMSWNQSKIVHNWNYCEGIMMKSFLRLGLYNDFVNKFYDDNILENGKVNNRKNFRNIYVKGALDDAAPARTLFYLINFPYIYNKNKYRKNLDYVHFELLKQPVLPEVGGNFIHKTNNKAWIKYPFSLDGIYMALPFLIEYDRFILKENIKQTTDTIFKRLDWISKHLKNEQGLYYHGCEANGKPNGVVWSRGVGWYVMAQVDILELFPEGEQKNILKNELKDLFDAMIKYQDKKTGLWHNIIYPQDKNLKCNYLETSGTAMMAYSLLNAYINNLVNDKKYAYAGLKAFNGVVENNLIRKNSKKYTLTDTYRVAIVFDKPETYSDCSFYIENDPKGVAPLIMASTLVPKTFLKLILEKY